MSKIIIYGWDEGLKKISLTHLQIEILKLSLREAKTNVDKILNNELVEIECDDLKQANLFINKSNEIGLKKIKIEN